MEVLFDRWDFSTELKEGIRRIRGNVISGSAAKRKNESGWELGSLVVIPYPNKGAESLISQSRLFSSEANYLQKEVSNSDATSTRRWTQTLCRRHCTEHEWHLIRSLTSVPEQL